MSVVLTDQDIADLVVGTLNRLGRLRFNQIATSIQNYEVMGRMMKRDKVQFDDGIGIRRTLMTKHSDGSRMTGLFETDTANVAPVLQTISIPWRHTTTSYAYERREILMNRGISRIVDILKTRRVDAMISLAELMEDQFWSIPASSSDELNVFGVPYWIVHNATNPSDLPTKNWTGGNPPNFSAGAGGLSSTDETRWANWSDDYSTVSKTDLVSKMRTAIRAIRFKSPVDVPDFRHGRGDQYRIYCNEATIKGFEDLGEASNENLGRDLATMDGVMVFRRNPITWVPYLDGVASGAGGNPVYMINFGYFHPCFLKGDYLRETEPHRAPNQHNAWAVHIDLTWNVLCTDRRCQAVLANPS